MQTVLSVVHGPVYGGAHNQIVSMLEPLRSRGFDTVALVPDDAHDTRARLEHAGVETISLSLGRLRATLDPATQLRFVAGLPREVAAIRRIVRERPVSVVQVHGPTNPHGAIAARLEGAAVVWQLYDTRAPMPLRRAAMPLLVRLADVIMSTGRRVAELHPGALGVGERLVPFVPPVDTDEYRPDPGRRASARAELGLSEEALVLGTVGNLNPSKGHEYLVRAAAGLRAREPRLHLRVLGAHSPAHADYERSVRAEARELGLEDGATIRFDDPGRRVGELMPALDVFALASVPRSEGIPTVLLEAMACGVPVVATDVGSVRELVEDGVNGFVVAPEDPDALAGAIGRLLTDPGLRERMAAAGRRTAESHGVESCADTHVAAYRLALEHRGLPAPLEQPAAAR